MKNVLFFLFLGLVLTWNIEDAFGQASNDSEKLDLLLKEIRELRVVVESSHAAQPPQPSSGQLKLRADERAIGSKDAPNTIVTFTDYQCPFCKQFAESTYPYLKKLYIDTGRVRFIVRDLPLPSHPDAEMAAQAARCAHEQGIFPAYHAHMQTHARDLSSGALLAYASELGTDIGQFGDCLSSEKYLEAVRDEARESMALGVEATPSFLVGQTTVEGVQGVWVVGAMPLGAFERAFEGAEGQAP